MNPCKSLIGVNYRIFSRREAIRSLSETAVSTLKRMGVRTDFHRLDLVLNEALTNAFLYGNLKIPSDLRESEDESFFWQTVDHREQDKTYGSKEIYLQLDIFEDKIQCTIKDQGDGFDWRGFIMALDSEDNKDVSFNQLLASHGRGLLIIRSCVDELQWNETGNEIRFAIKFPSEQPAQGEARMELIHETIKGINVIHPKGNLTLTTAQDFFSHMISLMEEGQRKFLFEMSALESIDSIGLGIVVRLAKRIREANGKLRFSGFRPEVMRTFELTKLDRVFEIYKTQEEALKTF